MSSNVKFLTKTFTIQEYKSVWLISVNIIAFGALDDSRTLIARIFAKDLRSGSTNELVSKVPAIWMEICVVSESLILDCLGLFVEPGPGYSGWRFVL